MANGGENGNGNGWRGTALAALWAVLLGIFGWIATDATTARDKMADEIKSNQQRIAILEESQRNTRDTLGRMENVLEDIRRQLQERRR